MAAEATTAADGVSVIERRAQRRDGQQRRVSTVDNARRRRWARRAWCTPWRSRWPATSGSTASRPAHRHRPPSRRREPRLALRARRPRSSAGLVRRHRVLAERRPRLRQPWQRTNHAGDPVTLLEGPAYVAGRAALCRCRCSGSRLAPTGTGRGSMAPASSPSPQVPSGRSTTSPATAPARGSRATSVPQPGAGHDGAVKIVGLGVTGLVAPALADRGRARRPRPLDTLVGGAVVAGAANLANLLRPAPRPGAQGHRGSQRLPARGQGCPAAAAVGCLARCAPPRPRAAPPCSATRVPTPRVRSSVSRSSSAPALGAGSPPLAGLAALPSPRSGQLHPGHRGPPRPARARRVGPAPPMTDRTLGRARLTARAVAAAGTSRS